MSTNAEPHASPALLSVIVPVYNEAASVACFWRRLAAVLDSLAFRSEVWFVDDGSTDGTAEKLAALAGDDSRIGVLSLSRNFGQQAALTAAFDHARGDWVLSLDGDGQHPPEAIPALLAQGRAGYQVVVARRSSSDTGLLKRMTSRLFYKLLNFLSRTAVVPAGTDFRLLTRPAVDALRRMREHHRFLRGMVHWIGYRMTIIDFDPGPRLAGHSKYSFTRLLRLAGDALFSFSLAPLRVAVVLGSVLVVLASIELMHTMWMILSDRRADLVPGWTSLIFSVLGIGGVQLITLGIIGQYVGMIFEQVKGRPLYLLRSPPFEPRLEPATGDAPAAGEAAS